MRMQQAYVYILKCKDNSLYVGSTFDMDLQLLQHQSGEGANYTKNKLPVELVYIELYDRIDIAFEREHQLKKWCRAKKQALIDENYEKLHELAKCNNITSHLNLKFQNKEE